MQLTRDDVAGIHGVLVLDETKAIHQLDLSDLTSAMGGEMSLNIGLGSFGWASVWYGQRGMVASRADGIWPRRIHGTGAHQGTYQSGANCPSTGEWRRPRSCLLLRSLKSQLGHDGKAVSGVRERDQSQIPARASPREVKICETDQTRPVRGTVKFCCPKSGQTFVQME